MSATQLQSLEDASNFKNIAERTEISGEGLDLFMDGSKQLLNNMEILKHDLELIKSGKDIIFALDFSEIFTFLNPKKSEQQNHQTIQLLLDSKQLKFTMLPGTIVELIKYLRRIISDNNYLQNQVKILFEKPVVNALIKYLVKQGNDFSIINQSVSRVRTKYGDVGQLNGLFERLTRLHESSNFIPIDKLINEESLLEPDAEILNSCQFSFNIYRPEGKGFNNFIDAHNYALAWALSEKYVSKMDTICMIVTSSQTASKVYRKLKWGDLRMKVNRPKLPETSLFRHPIQTLYISKILETEKGSKQLDQIISSLNFLIKEYGKLSSYKNYSKGKIPPNQFIKLPQNKRYIDAFIKFRGNYNELFNDIRYAIETDLISEENLRWEKGVGQWSADGRISNAYGQSKDPISTRVLFKVFDQITNLTLQIINKNKNILKNLPLQLIKDVDIEGVVVNVPKLDIKRIHNKIFDAQEVTISKEKEVFLAGDVYQDYYAIWWQSNVSFIEFIDAARLLVNNLPMKNLITTKEKLCNGVYIFYYDTSEPLILPINEIYMFDIDNIKDYVNERKIQMVRIADYWGDLCYDFEPFKSIPQRIGLISHSRHFDEIAKFIYRTNLKKTSLKEWKRVLHNSLNSIPKNIKKNQPKSHVSK